MENWVKTVNGSVLTVVLHGRLDTSNASDFSKELLASLEQMSKLILDFSDLFYISSAGLRALLQALKQMKQQGGDMIIRNLSQEIRDVFRMTGFDQILTVE